MTNDKWAAKAQQNLEAFKVWKATQTDGDFKQIVFRGQLNLIEVAKGIYCGKTKIRPLQKQSKHWRASYVREVCLHLLRKLPRKTRVTHKPTITPRIVSYSIQIGSHALRKLRNKIKTAHFCFSDQNIWFMGFAYFKNMNINEYVYLW